jgi:hypothetical protein
VKVLLVRVSRYFVFIFFSKIIKLKNLLIKNYLEKYKYGNTVREDLWDELEKVRRKPLNYFKYNSFLIGCN